MKRKYTKHTKLEHTLNIVSYEYDLTPGTCTEILKMYGNAEDVSIGLSFNGIAPANTFFNAICGVFSSYPFTPTEILEERSRIADKAKSKLLKSFSEPVLNFYYFSKIINAKSTMDVLAKQLSDKDGTIHWWLTHESHVLQMCYLVNRVGRLSDKALKSSPEISRKIKETLLFGEKIDFRHYQYKNMILKFKYAGERIWLDEDQQS